VEVLEQGFFVRKKLKQYVMNLEPVDESSCHLCTKLQLFNISVTCAHVLTGDKEEVKTAFYDE
jgi:hypothetical protein